MDKHRKSWGGRFTQNTDAAVERFTASIQFDQALALYDLRGSRAHARMLGATGIISKSDLAALLKGLDQIESEVATGTFPFELTHEDIHMNIEARLREFVGDVAGRLHAGRSRNDQVATDFALYLRDASRAVRRGLIELRIALLNRSRENIETLLPGYTHLQRAQPVRLAHHWLAHIEAFGRDARRFEAVESHLALSPLGSGALAGSTLPIDRDSTALELGFDGPTRNSMDAVASRDVALEFLAAGAISMVQLSRLAEELVLWSSTEFGFVQIDDAYATGSSLMPQKKNPDVPELVRAKAGRSIGNLVTLLSVVKGLPLTYNRDLQEDKEPVFDTVSTLKSCIEVMTGTISTLTVHRKKMRAAVEDPLLLATDLAEVLVKESVPFRDAHEAVGRLVRHVLDGGLDLYSMTASEIREFHPSFPGPVCEIVTLEGSVEARDGLGGTSRRRVEEALRTSESKLKMETNSLETGS